MMFSELVRVFSLHQEIAFPMIFYRTAEGHTNIFFVEKLVVSLLNFLNLTEKN